MRDVAVVGAGPAGLRAATVAARAGASVVLVDGYHRAGGQYFRQPASAAHAASPIQAQGRRLIEEARSAGVEFRLGTSVWGAEPGRLYLSTMDTVGFRSLVVATGAYERVAAFPGWTLPGVYTAGAVQSLLKEHGVVPGTRILLAGSGPLLLVVAAELVKRHVPVAGVLEATRVVRTAARHPGRGVAGLWRQGERAREGLAAAARLSRARVPLRTGRGVVRAVGTTTVEGAIVARLDDKWRPVPGTERLVECDTIAIHYSLVPATDLLALVGATLTYASAKGGWVPVLTERLETTVPGVFGAGDCTGIGGAGMSLAEGELAGLAAAGHAHDDAVPATLRRERRFQQLYGALFAARPGLADLTTADTIVCRCEDVPRSAIDAAVAAGARTPAMVKSVTRCGMGPCQGRLCRPVVEQLTGAPPGEPPTARPPLVPVPFEAMRAC
jgi:NADPH-dependent 2,4-dienoyl-CoA reductase/sulfur reductase-like enzyme